MEVKDIIYNHRKAKGITMKDLAMLIGVSEGTISRWESGDIENMRRDKIAAISKILDIPLEVLMGWDRVEDEKEAVPSIIMEVLKSDQKDRLVEYAEMLKKWGESDDH